MLNKKTLMILSVEVALGIFFVQEIEYPGLLHGEF